MSLSTVVILALLSGAPAAPQTPPIFNPGAPGEASREITAAEAVALSRTGFVEADVRFMQHMIVHHAQAVEMVAVLEARAASETVRRMGDRIAQSQAAEMALMEEWLTGNGISSGVDKNRATTFLFPALSKATSSLSPSIASTTP